MPYRAMFSTIVTATLALAAITMWVWAVTPFLTKVTDRIPVTTHAAESQTAVVEGVATPASDTEPTTASSLAAGHSRALSVEQMEKIDASREGSPERMFRGLVRGVLLLSFLLLCLLLVVGFAATFREWGRYGARRRAMLMARTHQKTPYVDAWTLAGQRLESGLEPSDSDPGSEPYG